MLRVSVEKAVKTFRDSADKLTGNEYNTAVFRALNESILQARTEARAAVKAIYSIPQRYVAGINVNKATSVFLVAELYASSKPIPMDAFSPKFETSTQSLSISRKGVLKQRSFKRSKKNPGVGVSIEVLKGKREVVPYAFLIAVGKPRVFARGQYKGGTSYGFIQRNKRVNKEGNDIPVKPLISVTVHAAVLNESSLKKIEDRANKAFPVSLERNVNYLLTRVGT